jgi:hypothetical protein
MAVAALCSYFAFRRKDYEHHKKGGRDTRCYTQLPRTGRFVWAISIFCAHNQINGLFGCANDWAVIPKGRKNIAHREERTVNAISLALYFPRNSRETFAKFRERSHHRSTHSQSTKATQPKMTRLRKKLIKLMNPKNFHSCTYKI